MASSASWAISLLLALAPALARADLGINVYGLSWHFDRDKARELNVDNWFNPGLGLRYRIPGEKLDYFFDAGFYRDSGRNTAVLAGAAAHWHASESARLGLALVVLNSKTYNDGRTFVAPLPIAAWELRAVTLNVVYMPKVHEVNDINTLGFWLTYWLR
jgi:Antimicrobial peptide resistance and lipid A acylation protein PagP